MKTQQLDELVETLSSSPIPECPGNIEANVFRKIRLIESSQLSFGSWLQAYASQLKLLVPILGVAVAASVFVTMLSINIIEVPSNHNPAKALGFESFTESSTFKWDQ